MNDDSKGHRPLRGYAASWLLLTTLGLTSCAGEDGGGGDGRPDDTAAGTTVTVGVLRTEAPGREAMEVPFWLGDEQLRMDVTVPLEMSVVWTFGEAPSLRMIEHAKTRFVEWGTRELEGARSLMKSRIPDDVDLDTWKFVQTGRTARIGDYEAYEVDVAGPRLDGATRLWLSDDVRPGLVEFFAGFAAALDGTTTFPMTGGQNDVLGLSRGTHLPLDHLGRASGLPDGSVVRIVDGPQNGADDAQTVITLLSIESRPVEADVFAVPDGYVETLSLSDGPA